MNTRTHALYPDDPQALMNSRGLGDLIASSESRPVHVVFVHGMRADGPGGSATLRSELARFLQRLHGRTPAVDPPTRHFIDLGPAPDAKVFGQPIWSSDTEWQASRPYVERYTFSSAKRTVIVDEVNWWPLLFPIKCRFLVAPETFLSGTDRDHLKLCARTDAPFFPWLSSAQLSEALSRKPRAGGGAKLNASIKQQILNWGLADAVIVSGPLKKYFRSALNEAFAYAQDAAAPVTAAAADAEQFVVISESLGSFVVLDAFANQQGESEAAQKLSERVGLLYFFANQFALLELGRVGGLPAFAAEAESAGLQPSELLRRWARQRPASATALETAKVKQLIAFSDPSDLLTYDVPPITGDAAEPTAVVINVHTRNAWRWLRLFANPVKAHTTYSKNKAVLAEVFRIHEG